MDTKKGFTLIELLVVISIIALLMAVLIPALRAAKAAAAGAVCVSNLHSLAMAWFTFAVENDDRIVNGDVPSGGEERGVNWVTPPLDEEFTPNVNSPKCDIEWKKRGIREGQLFPYVKDVDVYHCPADKRYRRPPDPDEFAGPDGGFRTYSIPEGLNDPGYAPHAITRYSQIKKPAEKYAFIEENEPRGFNKGSWALDNPDNLVGSWRWTDPVASWHNEKSTLGWADGHATVRRWVEKATVKLAKMDRWGPETDETTIKGYREHDDHKLSRDILFMKRHHAHIGIDE